MATWNSSTDARLRADVYAPLPGRSPSLGIPFRQSILPHEVSLAEAEGAVITDVPKAATKTIETVQSAGDLRLAGPSYDWFDRVHLLPRSKVEFGNILTQVEREYVVHSAHRTLSVSLTTVQNNALPGVDLPDLTVPQVIPPGSSILDPDSTDNSGGVGLGTLVAMKVLALPDGLPRFDTSIEFTFSDGDVLELLVSGTRIILLTPEYELPVVEVLSFLTDVLPKIGGREQRISVRKQPRQGFQVLYQLDGDERRRMEVVLMDWLDNLFGFPLLHEQLRLTAAVSAGATTYPVVGADEVDLRVGGLAVVITDAHVFDVLNLVAVTPTLVTAADPSINGYPVGTMLLPLRTARVVDGRVATARRGEDQQGYRVEVEVDDNDTGALAGSAAGWPTYLGRVLLDECNVVAGDASGSFSRRIYRLDNQTGIVAQSSSWDRYKRSHQKGFVARDRAEVLKLRRLLLYLRGRQKSFWIPTFAPDLEVVADLAMGAATVDVAHVEYTRHAQSREPKRTFRITFTDGSSLVRVVQSSVEVSATVERLTLDTTWPANRTVAEVSRVMFYELVRLDSDELAIVYPRVGHARLDAPVRAVFQ